jgi:hypothetical protein
MPIVQRFALTKAETTYVKELLDGESPTSEADDREVTARLLEMLAESVGGTSADYLRRLATKARGEK